MISRELKILKRLWKNEFLLRIFPLSLFVGNNYNVIIYNKVLIVDDIYTTGTTIDACAECLKRAGVKEVYAVTLCVGRGF